jgi:hypothetical protein
MKKQVDVVMLPTEKASYIFTINVKNTSKLSYSTIGGKIHKTDIYQPQHLYFLSDDEIKEICWCYDTINKEIVLFQGALPKYHYRGYKKIIATTNTDLDKLCGCGNNCGAKPSNLPRPSNEFLKKFCELGGVDKVLVEYDTIKNNCECFATTYEGCSQCLELKLKVAPDNTITIYPIE